jgi:hypothetical protein
VVAVVVEEFTKEIADAMEGIKLVVAVLVEVIREVVAVKVVDITKC